MNENSFGQQLASLRRDRGYSQFQLSRLLHVSDKAISKWETGGAKPRTSTIMKLAEVLDVEVGELFALNESVSRKGGRMNKNDLWHAAEDRLYEFYGSEPELLVIDRFKQEKNALREKETIVLFAAIARVREVAENNHALMTARAFVNGSFVAWLMGATDINPLTPHSYCPKCKRMMFYPDALNGWDLQDVKCTCGEIISCDGHGLPFGTYSGSAFDSVDVVIPERIASDAWKSILSFVQRNYSCSRHVTRQDEDTGFPGVFSRLYLHPRSDDVVYNNIEEVPEISDSMHQKILSKVPHITVLGSKIDQLYVNAVPAAHKIISPSLIRKIKEKTASPYQFTGPSTFQGLVQAQAASHMTLINGCSLDEFAKECGLEGYADLPLTREDIWKLVIESQNGSEALAADIVYNVRRGIYTRELTERDRNIMQRAGLPAWFPEYVKMVRYLFPKAHCAEYAWHDLLREWTEMNETEGSYR